MAPGDKGGITIKISISSPGADMNIDQDGHLVQRKEQNMFEEKK